MQIISFNKAYFVLNHGDGMKIAYVLPHSFEHLYRKRMSTFKSLDDLEYEIICNSDHYSHRFCKATQLAGMEPRLYYFSNLTKSSKYFIHKYGHLMMKIPVNLKREKYGQYGWEYSHSILRQLSNDSMDLIFVFSYMLNVLLPVDMYDILALYCKKNNYPLIARHGGNSAICSILNGRCTLTFRQWIKRLTLNIADKIIVPSQMELSVLKYNLKIKEEKLILLKNPVDLNNFYEMPKEIAAEKLDKDPTKTYILFVGRLDIDKGIQDMINVLPKLINIYQDIVFLVVGEGPFENELRNLVIRKNLENHVSFEGPIFHDSLKFYYNIADVFVLPTHREGTPNVMQEALACNLPSVGTNVGGIPDILSGHVGIIVPPKDESKLYKGVRKVLDGNFNINQEKRNRLLKRWSMENFGQRLKKIYEEVLDKY